MKYKRFSKLIIVLNITALLLGSCSHSDIPKLNPKKPETITLWHYYHGVQQIAFDDLVTTFNQTEGMNKGIIVESSSLAGVTELSENVMMSAKGEVGTLPMPNIFSSYSDSAYELLKMDKLAYIDDYISEKELEEYIPSYINEGKIADGRLVVLPIAKATEIFMLNKTNWDEFENNMRQSNPVSLEMLNTWEGIVEAAELYYEWSDAKTPELNDGKALFGIDSSANYFITGARSLGADITSIEDGRVVINLDEEVLRKLWDIFYVPMIKGHFASLGRFRSDDVKTGDLLSFIGSTTSAAYFPTQITLSTGESYDIDEYVTTVPVFENAEKMSVIQQGAGMCVAKSTKLKELASVEFLKWFTDNERNISFAINSAGYLPVKQEALTSNEMNERISQLSSSDKPSDGVLAQVIEQSIEQIKTYDLYSAPVYTGSSQVRVIFEGIKSEAADLRNELLKKSSIGTDYDKEIERLTDDNAFKLWYNTLKEQLSSISIEM